MCNLIEDLFRFGNLRHFMQNDEARRRQGQGDWRGGGQDRGFCGGFQGQGRENY